MLHLIDLAWVTGKLGRKGCGINTYTEEANEQGAVDMGVAPEFLPGPVTFTDPQARETFVRVWGNNLPDVARGANLIEILDRCRAGDIKALYLVGENPLETLPASYDVKSALANVGSPYLPGPLPNRNRQNGSCGVSCFNVRRKGRDCHKSGRERSNFSVLPWILLAKAPWIGILWLELPMVWAHPWNTKPPGIFKMKSGKCFRGITTWGW